MHPGYSIGSVYLHRDPIDFRKQINGLAALVQGELELSPFMDAVFVFTNRGRTSLKVLYWHRNGFCLWQKRLETDRFAWPKGESFEQAHPVSASEFQRLLEGLDPWHKNAHKVLNYKHI